MERITIHVYLLHLHWNFKKERKLCAFAEALWYVIKPIFLNYYQTSSSRFPSAVVFYGCILQGLRANIEWLRPHFLSEKSKPNPSAATCSCFPVQVRKSGLRFLSTCHSRKGSGKLLPEHTLLVRPGSDSSQEWCMDVSEKGRWPSTTALCRTWGDVADLAPADTRLWRGVKSG